MSKQKKEGVSQIEMCMLLAKGILHTRSLRRRFGVQLLTVIMLFFSLGVFVIGSWLETDRWIFAIYWGFVFILTLILMFLAMYDAMRCVVEVKAEQQKSMAKDLREIARLLKEAEAEESKSTPQNQANSTDQ